MLRAILFVLMLCACFAVNALLAHGQPVPAVVGNDMGIAAPAAGDVQSLADLVKEVQALRAAKASGDKASLYLALSGIVALLLKFLTDWFKSLKADELSDRAKHFLPWIITCLGGGAAVMAKYVAGESWTNAIIIGGAAPGSILVHELLDGLKNLLKKKPIAIASVPKDPPAPIAPAALVLLLALGVGVSSCGPAQSAEWRKIGGLVATQCAIPGAQQALVDVVNDASQPGATAAGVAEAVALKYGVAAALCAAGVFFANAGDLIHARLEPQDAVAVAALHYIQEHADDLARKVEVRKAAK